MKRLLFFVLAFFLVVAPAFAVNTTTYDKGTITIIHDGATDWVWSTDLSTYSPPAGGIVVYSIQFNTSAASDIAVFRDGSLTAHKIFATPPAGGVETYIKYYPPIGKRCRPYIEGDDTVVGTPANSLILIEVEPW